MCLRRSVQDWELSDLVELLGLLYKIKGLGVGEDELRWTGTGNGVFPVSLFIIFLVG